ncbi:MAG: KTSC domain-containing protein [Kaistella sp.]|nr:KTSC domain-containing protein [Kaistella sp.]
MPSTVIKKYFYHPEQEILTIIYVSGSVYDYFEVPQVVFDEFRAAYSKGVFLHKNIKPFYRYQKKE